jgi:restriction system protein
MQLNHLLTAAISLVVMGYLCYQALPKKNSLHKVNQKKAKILLKHLQHRNYDHAYVFGILRNTNPFVFEELLLLCFKKKGYKIKTNHAYTGDGGIDGTFFDKQGNKFLIQAKRYKNTITPQHVKEFGLVVKRQGAAGGFFIHTGRTGFKSYENLTTNIRFISGKKLLNLLGLVQVSSMTDCT